MLTNPDKGEYSFPHDALLKDPAQALGLNNLGIDLKVRRIRNEASSF